MWDLKWLRNKWTAEQLGRRFLILACAYASLKLIASRRARALQLEAEGSKSDKKIVSQATLQLLLAFVAGWFDVICFKQYKCYANMMTGNTVNLCYKIGNLETVDVSFLAAAILNFSGGYTTFKYVDMLLKGQRSCTAVAPIILTFFAATDVLRGKFPKSRWHMLPLSFACGIINCISAEKARIASNMVTGHYQSLSTIFADLLFKGTSIQQRASALDSIRVVLTFCSALALGNSRLYFFRSQ